MNDPHGPQSGPLTSPHNSQAMPIVVRPTLPSNSTVMPTNVSANTVGLTGHKPFDWRRMAFFGIPLAILAVVILGVWLAARNLHPLRQKTIINEGYTYTFQFYKSAESVNLLGGEGLQYNTQASVIAKPTTDAVITDCARVGTGWHPLFTIPANSTTYPVCTTDNKVFLVVFPYSQKRHLFEVVYTIPQTNQLDEVKHIMQSLQIAKQ